MTDPRGLRPRTRQDCIQGPRPCPWVECRYHLAVDVSRRGRIRLPHYGLTLAELEETCALDVADRGAHTLEQVGDLLGITRERIRQIEQLMFRRLRHLPVLRALLSTEMRRKFASLRRT